MISLLENYYIISVVNHERKTVTSYCCTEHHGIGICKQIVFLFGCHKLLYSGLNSIC